MSPTPFTSSVQTRETTDPLLTCHLRRDLLHLANRLPLALFASELPPWQTVFYHFRRLRLTGAWFRLLTALRGAERTRDGRNVQPSAAILDAQSVKTVEESARICGFDAHKHVKGRKRHILVDTLGLLLAVYVTPADFHDTRGARCLLAGLAPLFPRLAKIWADAAYRGQELADWCQTEGSWDLEVVERAPGERWLQRPASQMGGGANLCLAFS